MTSYDEDWDFPIVFPPHHLEITIGKVVADAGRTQLPVSETAKYPHVTYFFNSGREEPYDGEVRELVPSPRDVPTYDHEPEMSARSSPRAPRRWAARASWPMWRGPRSRCSGLSSRRR